MWLYGHDSGGKQHETDSKRAAGGEEESIWAPSDINNLLKLWIYSSDDFALTLKFVE